METGKPLGYGHKKGFLKALADGKLTKTATIVRTRQKIQAKHEFLKPYKQ